jgi:excisionase family DNA binding protein
MTETAATQSTERETVSLPEAGKILGISRSSIFRAAARGQVPVLTIGRRKLVPRAALTRLLETATAIK